MTILAGASGSTPSTAIVLSIISLIGSVLIAVVGGFFLWLKTKEETGSSSAVATEQNKDINATELVKTAFGGLEKSAQASEAAAVRAEAATERCEKRCDELEAELRTAKAEVRELKQAVREEGTLRRQAEARVNDLEAQLQALKGP